MPFVAQRLTACGILSCQQASYRRHRKAITKAVRARDALAAIDSTCPSHARPKP